ncbi:DMT family transporter [Vannielia litorea]|uniref:EamA domain-containing membrane protein RarD n=1 Tax=Vannielia litorea TaxID=1217970 RepID=A0A1N6HGB7_9RHOB|nr:DMT family transporter [Vannielia litorea]SIO18777.1 EamA domain-containing membrane protein RarD [Vannielia litorea]
MRPLLGISLTLSAIFFFSIMGALVKAADRIPVGETVFFRAGCALPVIVIWLWMRGDMPGGLKVLSVKSHAVRAIVGSAAMGLGFLGLRYLPLPEVTALRFITPILIVIFAALLLKERVRLLRISAVSVGLVGVLIIMWPRLNLEGGERELIGTAMILTSALMASLAQIFVKAMAAKESTAAIVFYFSGTATVLSLLTIPWGWVWPTPLEWVLLVGAGLTGGAGQILVTSSYRYADASLLAPYTYSSMIWALVLGYFVFAEVPTVQMLAGAALVICAGIFIVWRERKLGKTNAAEGKINATMR